MVEFTCEAIGMEQDELQERVVQGLVTRILGTESEDEYGETIRPKVMKEVNDIITNTVHRCIENIANEHVYPMAEKLVTEHVFQPTTNWGEKKGEPRSFIEYLDEKAVAYFRESVDAGGRAQEEIHVHSRRDWKAVGNRINFMVDKSLAKQIKEALDDAIGNLHLSLADALAETARDTLAKVAAASKVEVRTEPEKK